MEGNMRKISFLLVVVLVLTTLIPALPVLAADEKVENTFTDTEATNIVLSTADDYIKFFNHLYVWGNKTFKDQTITLAGDIVFNDTTVDGWYTKSDAKKINRENTNKWNGFKGTFDGGNHTLKGVIVEGVWTTQNSTGLFPLVFEGATIKNLNIDGFYVCSTQTTDSSRPSVGGLIGKSMSANITVDHCTLKNGIVTGVKDGTVYLSTLIGGLQPGAVTDAYSRITDTVVSNVQVVKGETKCKSMGGMIGFIGVNAGSQCLDLSGSVIQPTNSMDAENPLNPVGEWAKWGDYKIQVRNDATGYTTAPDKLSSNLQSFCQALTDCGAYGATAIPTVKLAGYQYSTEGDAIRFVGLIKKSVVDAHSVKELGFEVTVGETTVGTDKIQCTKVYESILENGKPLAAPDGYYYFTFVVTGVKEGTEFAVKGITVADEKTCNTTVGNYVYSRSAS